MKARAVQHDVPEVLDWILIWGMGGPTNGIDDWLKWQNVFRLAHNGESASSGVAQRQLNMSFENVSELEHLSEG